MRWISVGLLTAALLRAGDVTPERLVDAARDPANWLTYFGSYESWRYSRLDQIHRDNVSRVVPVWAFETGEADGGNQCAPIVVDGVMYVTSSWNKVFALDAASGEELWSFRTGSGHRGSRISYAVEGRQYVATPSGWGSSPAGLTTQLWPEAADFPSGSSIFVFALPEEGSR